jgi:A/G-specific adenine glycosylase
MTAAPDSIAAFRKAVLGWYDVHGRKNLPWQIDQTPFRVWISEIMLQQTQVATVIPFFQRFTERFPDVATLADRPLEQVLELWSGLGYYARARNLHKSARQLVAAHDGEFPTDPAALTALPGIGRSTAGAILSLGHGLPAAILDGNVKRVLCRHWGIRGWPGETAVARQLWSLTEQLTPDKRSGDYNQAMMDLGATVCTARSPLCSSCRLAARCSAYREGTTGELPAPKPKRTVPARQAHLLILRNRQGELLLERRPPVGIWGGLWCFPLFSEQEQLVDWIEKRALAPISLEQLPRQRHTFSHFHLDYLPVLVDTEQAADRIGEPERERWHLPGDEPKFGVPAPIRKLLDALGEPDPLEHTP